MSFRTSNIEAYLWRAASNTAGVPDATIPVATADAIELLKALKTWREIACWGSEVLAASAEDLMYKRSTPQTERSRQLSICKTMAAALQHETSNPIPMATAQREYAAERLTNAQAIVPPPKRGSVS